MPHTSCFKCLNIPPPPIDLLLFRREEVLTEGIAIEPEAAAETVIEEDAGERRKKAKAKGIFL